MNDIQAQTRRLVAAAGGITSQENPRITRIYQTAKRYAQNMMLYQYAKDPNGDWNNFDRKFRRSVYMGLRAAKGSNG